MTADKHQVDLTEGVRMLIGTWIGPLGSLAAVVDVMAGDLERQAAPFLTEEQRKALSNELWWLKRDVRMGLKAHLN